jgi:hypothetical protein
MNLRVFINSSKSSWQNSACCAGPSGAQGTIAGRHSFSWLVSAAEINIVLNIGLLLHFRFTPYMYRTVTLSCSTSCAVPPRHLKGSQAVAMSWQCLTPTLDVRIRIPWRLGWTATNFRKSSTFRKKGMQVSFCYWRFLTWSTFRQGRWSDVFLWTVGHAHSVDLLWEVCSPTPGTSLHLAGSASPVSLEPAWPPAARQHGLQRSELCQGPRQSRQPSLTIQDSVVFILSRQCLMLTNKASVSGRSVLQMKARKWKQSLSWTSRGRQLIALCYKTTCCGRHVATRQKYILVSANNIHQKT